MTDIGEKIRFYRNYRGMTQKELGIKTGSSLNLLMLELLNMNQGN